MNFSMVNLDILGRPLYLLLKVVPSHMSENEWGYNNLNAVPTSLPYLVAFVSLNTFSCAKATFSFLSMEDLIFGTCRTLNVVQRSSLRSLYTFSFFHSSWMFSRTLPAPQMHQQLHRIGLDFPGELRVCPWAGWIFPHNTWRQISRGARYSIKWINGVVD